MADQRPGGSGSSETAASATGVVPTPPADPVLPPPPPPPGKSRVAFPAFPHANPYPVQRAFMQQLWRAVDAGSLALFESPTGTGKTLSLICGVLHWVEDARAREGGGAGGPTRGEAEVAEAAVEAARARAEAAAIPPPTVSPSPEPDASPATPAWLLAAAAQPREDGGSSDETDDEAGDGPTALGGLGRGLRRERGPADPDADFLLEDEPDGPGERGGHDGSPHARAAKRLRFGPRARAGAGSQGSWALGGGSGRDRRGAPAHAPPPPRLPRAIFSSRTHSQLAQFVGEFRRSGFGGRLSLASLASRSALCINEGVLRGAPPALINERCLELAERASKGGDREKGRVSHRGCPYRHPSDERVAAMDEEVLSRPLDVEDLASLGRARGVCPYYASRRAAATADVVLAPYASLLGDSAREAVGLDLTGSVVVFDEAHNLLDAVRSSHSATLRRRDALAAARALGAYLDSFRDRLSASNCVRVQTLALCAIRLAGDEGRPAEASRGAAGQTPPAPSPWASAVGRPAAPRRAGTAALGGASGPSPAPTAAPALASISSVSGYLAEVGLEGLNLLRLVRECRELRTPRKVAGWWAAEQRRRATAGGDAGVAVGASDATRVGYDAPPREVGGGGGAAESGTGDAGDLGAAGEPAIGPLQSLLSLLACLSSSDGDGIIIRDARGEEVRFALLDPAARFGPVGGRARAVVLASGTLAPAEGLAELARARLREGAGRDARLAERDAGSPTAAPDARGGEPLAGGVAPGWATGPGEAAVPSPAPPSAPPGPPDPSVPSPTPTDSPLPTMLEGTLPHPPRLVRRFSCGHVVPPWRVLAMAVGRGPGGVALDLRATQAEGSGGRAALEAAAQAVAEAAAVCPGGMVVFLPSFLALERFRAVLERLPGVAAGDGDATRAAGGAPPRLLALREPRTAGEVEGVLREHSRAARERAAAIAGGPPGAAPPPAPEPAATPGLPGRPVAPTPVLLAVVGGKLSEGINFGDELARAVAVLGVPFPDARDAELRAILARVAGLPVAPPPPSEVVLRHPAAAEAYAELAAKALNQCVGRAIRSASDYAAVLLLDRRYCTGVAGPGDAPEGLRPGGGGAAALGGERGAAGGERAEGGRPAPGPSGRLPRWLRHRTCAPPDWPSALGELRGFFATVAARDRREGAAGGSAAGRLGGQGAPRAASGHPPAPLRRCPTGEPRVRAPALA